tara:strand:- start:302 stop:730 length:429 start_codon:yes stop_codon:yes gene_type:complete
MNSIKRTDAHPVTNHFYVTLKDDRKLTESQTTYLFIKLTNDFTKNTAYYYPDSVVHTARHTKIRLIEPTNITLKHEGFWTMTIYETLSTGLTSDASLTSSDIVHSGKLFVVDTGLTEVSYTEYTPPTNNTNTTNNNTVYLNI